MHVFVHFCDFHAAATSSKKKRWRSSKLICKCIRCKFSLTFTGYICHFQFQFILSWRWNFDGKTHIKSKPSMHLSEIWKRLLLCEAEWGATANIPRSVHIIYAGKCGEFGFIYNGFVSRFHFRFSNHIGSVMRMRATNQQMEAETHRLNWLQFLQALTQQHDIRMGHKYSNAEMNKMKIKIQFSVNFFDSRIQLSK